MRVIKYWNRCGNSSVSPLCVSTFTSPDYLYVFYPPVFVSVLLALVANFTIYKFNDRLANSFGRLKDINFLRDYAYSQENVTVNVITYRALSDSPGLIMIYNGEK